MVVKLMPPQRQRQEHLVGALEGAGGGECALELHAAVASAVQRTIFGSAGSFSLALVLEHGHRAWTVHAAVLSCAWLEWFPACLCFGSYCSHLILQLHASAQHNDAAASCTGAAVIAQPGRLHPRSVAGVRWYHLCVWFPVLLAMLGLCSWQQSPPSNTAWQFPLPRTSSRGWLSFPSTCQLQSQFSHATPQQLPRKPAAHDDGHGYATAWMRTQRVQAVCGQHPPGIL